MFQVMVSNNDGSSPHEKDETCYTILLTHTNSLIWLLLEKVVAVAIILPLSKPNLHSNFYIL